MGILGRQGPMSDRFDAVVIHERLNHCLRDAFALVFLEDINITKLGETAVVGHKTGKANLVASFVVGADAETVSDSPLDYVSSNIGRPVAIRQVIVDLFELKQVFIEAERVFQHGQKSWSSASWSRSHRLRSIPPP